MTSTALLRVRDLAIEFTDRGRVTNRPVRGVELQIGEREVLGVVGETGCGKSITAHAILGTLPAQARATGEILFDGVEQLTLPEQQRALNRGDAISIVFQNPGTAFNPVFRLGQQMQMVLRRHRGIRGAEAREVIAQRLRDVGLPDTDRVMGAYPHELSGGMLQRVMIAMALLCEPKLLILDEPTEGIQPNIVQQIHDVIRRLNRELGLGIVIVEQNVPFARQVSDRFLVIDKGRVAVAGSAAELTDEIAERHLTF